MADGQSATPEQVLDHLLDQQRFDPPDDFSAAALLTDTSEHEAAAADPQGWWAQQARALHWFEEWDTVLDDSDPPYCKWFVGGKINASYNCLDRHMAFSQAKALVNVDGARRKRKTAAIKQQVDDAMGTLADLDIMEELKHKVAERGDTGE